VESSVRATPRAASINAATNRDRSRLIEGTTMPSAATTESPFSTPTAIEQARSQPKRRRIREAR